MCVYIYIYIPPSHVGLPMSNFFPGQVKAIRLLRAQASAIVKELRKDEDASGKWSDMCWDQTASWSWPSHALGLVLDGSGSGAA